ncbi:MAG: triose-phosphate isomerase, partial [Candidatus Aminicenantales bacterium]
MKLTNEKPFIAGNWKMHKIIPDARELVRAIREESADLHGAQLVVLPPFTVLSEVKKELQGSLVQWGAQNLFWEEKGAFTGEISPLMLKD